MGNVETMQKPTQIRVWDLPLRLFHWLLVVAIAVTFLSAEEGSPLIHWHMILGWIAAVLLFFRIVWGFVGRENARFSGMLKSGGARICDHRRDIGRFRCVWSAHRERRRI